MVISAELYEEVEQIRYTAGKIRVFFNGHLIAKRTYTKKEQRNQIMSYWRKVFYGAERRLYFHLQYLYTIRKIIKK